MQKWSSIVQYLCISILDLKYTFSDLSNKSYKADNIYTRGACL